MFSTHISVRSAWAPALLAAILLMVPQWAVRHQLFADRAVFLYAGRLILHGGVPYRDVWDNKPPGIFFIAAAGLFLGRGSLWGPLLLETVALTCAVYFGFAALRLSCGKAPALFASCLWILTFNVLDPSPNGIVESYTLPLQFVAFYLFFQTLADGQFSRYLFFQGTIAAAIMLIQPQSIGLSASIILLSLVRTAYHRSYRKALQYAGSVLLGILITSFPVAVFFAVTHSFDVFYDAFIRYNMLYSAVTFEARGRALHYGLATLQQSSFSVIALAGWLTTVVLLIRYRSAGSPLVIALLLAIDLPLECMLVSWSGRKFPNHFITLLPVGALAIALLAHRLTAKLTSLTADSTTAAVVAVSLLISIGLLVGPTVIDLDQGPFARIQLRTDKSIKSLLNGDDAVLVWGKSTASYWNLGKRAPTRFVYLQPLFSAGDMRAAYARELLNDIVTKRPSIIVDGSKQADPMIPPLDPVQREAWMASGAMRNSLWAVQTHGVGIVPDMAAVLAYINSHYEERGTSLPNGWPVFWRNDSVTPATP